MIRIALPLFLISLFLWILLYGPGIKYRGEWFKTLRQIARIALLVAFVLILLGTSNLSF